MNKAEIKNLLERALHARSHCYAPYSHYPVGAAVLASDGSIYEGCNMENVSYPAGLCAERNAIGSAICDGKRKFTAIAIIGSFDDYTMPCGICRQVMAEFGIPVIICGKSVSDYKVFSLNEIFPAAFDDDSLKNSDK